LWTFILFISYNTYYYPLDVDPVAVYYWFVAGMILKLPILDQEKDEDTPELEASTKTSRGNRQADVGGALRRRSPPEETSELSPS
jgi:hypothetical protein